MIDRDPLDHTCDLSLRVSESSSPPKNRRRMAQSSDSALVQIRAWFSCTKIEVRTAINHPFIPAAASSPLEIPEILELILDEFSRKENTSIATVCRTWSHPALDRIWRSMDSLIPLFTLIGPIAKQPNDEWVRIWMLILLSTT